MRLREASAEVVLQTVAGVRVRSLLAEPVGLHRSVEARTERQFARHGCLVAILVLVEEELALRTLTVELLHLQSLCSLTPCEVATIRYAEALLVRSALCCNEDYAVACTRTVERCRVRALKYRDRLDVLGVDVE